jgi:hypothetical protein
MSKWWNEDMSDSSQGLYADPALAIQMATLPQRILDQQAYDEAMARQARGGAMKQMMGAFASVGKSLDGALSHVPGWGVTKNATKVAWYPVDKAASGAYWLYSNAISQPISTVLLMSARDDMGTASYFSGKDWADTYHKAEHISIGQAFENSEGVYAGLGQDTALGGIFGFDKKDFTKSQSDAIKAQSDRFLYDSDYWRDKQKWKYTVGSGALDFAFTIGADPTYAGVKAVSGAVKAGRSIQVAGAAEKNSSKFQSQLSKLADKAISPLVAAPMEPSEISRAKSINNFFKWSDGKSGAEIAQHPIWGSGRRVNPFKNQLSDVFAHADDVEKPLILRFAAGDNNALIELASKNKDLVSQIGRMGDNRQLVDSTKFDPDLFEHFLKQERAGAAAPASLSGTGIGGVSPATVGGTLPRLAEAPHPRPVGNTPADKVRQAGWDRAYGAIEKQAGVYRSAVGDILKSGNGVRPMEGAPATLQSDMLRFEDWKVGQLKLLDTQLARIQEKEGFYQSILGENAAKGMEDLSPGQSNLFGSMKQMYRMGPLALRNTEKAAGKNFAAATVDRMGRHADGGFVSRTIRQGYYTVPLRIVQSFGDKLPQTLINHNDADASDRVLDMLKRVPGLGQETRAKYLNAYNMAGDKVSKAATLDQIHTRVIEHMASNVHGLDPMIARNIDNMVKNGYVKTMSELTGAPMPKPQIFSAAKSTDELGPVGTRVDKVEDGDGFIIHPVAKTQLKYSQPLLDVNELDRILSRNSGFLSSLKRSGGNARDDITSVADTFSNIWKATTLLRPGYVVRAPSEEMAASAIKFGLMTSIMDTAHGGKNWALNRMQQVSASLGSGSYASASGGKFGRVQILDPDVVAKAKARGDQVTKINVNRAWPVIQARISDERSALKSVQSDIAKMKKDDPRLPDLQDLAREHQEIIDEHVDYAHEILREATDNTGRRIGEGVIEHEGQVIPQAFSKTWEHPIPRDQITSGIAMETMFARGESIDTGRLIKTGSWVGINPGEANHMSSWLDALNKQWGQDDLFKLVAQDGSLKAARAFLKTPAGKYHLSLLGPHARDQDRLLAGISDTIEQYLPKGTGLQAKLAKGEEITEQELRAAMSPDDFPVVHGEEIKGLTGQGHAATAAGVVDKIINNSFNRLSTIPTDILSRHPTYLRAQEARMRQLVDQELSYQKSVGKTGDSIKPQDLQAMLNKSDTMARKDISQIVYDPTRTTATQALRFIAPFMAAHVDGLERWAGLIAEKPTFVTQAAKIYNAPVASQLITDNQGNAVGLDGYADQRDANGKIIGRKFVGIQDRVIHLRVPDGTTNLKKLSEGIPIKIQALNTILPGDPWWNPGTGPYVQVAASSLARKNPAIGDFLQWAKVLPYGPAATSFAGDVTQTFAPKYIKDAWDAFHTDDEKFQSAMLDEYKRQSAEHLKGGPPPDMKTAEANAKKFYYLKALTSWLSPAQTQQTPLTGTPYQFFVDQYKKLQDVDPKTADDEFLAKYGPDYFIFTASLSKSMGIAPTVSALNTAKEYKDLIAKDPSLASFIVGDTYNKGDFSSSAYKAEQGMTIGGQKVREKVSVQDAVANNEKNLGWSQYKQIMNALDAGLVRAGFTSYTQSGAESYLNTKRQAQQDLGARYPAWEQDFNTTDRGIVPRRIKAFESLVTDPKLASDPMRSDIGVLAHYLEMRKQFQAALRARGVVGGVTFDMTGTPTGNNADIGNAWRAFQFGMKNQNTKFADVFNRYLANDDLQ